MEKGGFGDGFDVRLEGEGGVQDDAQVADFRGWGDGATIDLKEKIPNLLEQCLRCHNHELCFLAV